MTEKEKSKAYDEAIERAKKLGIAEEIFPELKEDDTERIRKNCIHFLELQKQHHAATFEIEECIDWLKKQGEKSADKVEPKFKVGDWVVTSYGKVNQVVSVDKYGDGYTLNDGVYFSGSWCDMYYLWTIQDAKDGDIIHLGTVTAIFKKYIGREKCICYCSFCKDGGFEIPIENGEDNVYGCYNATPTTKEQRDTFMKIMKDAGYKWDAEKKELKKEKVK